MDNKQEKLHNIRHSLAHVLASAVLEMFPKAQLGVGPVIENGFFYDFLLPRPLTPEDIKVLEKRMRALVQSKLPFERIDQSTAEAKEFFTKSNQPFKVQLINDIEKFGTTKADEILNSEKSASQPISGSVISGLDKVSLYKTGKFIDLCRGGHVENTSQIRTDAFKLDKVSGAYWRGDQANPQMQRVYGLAFETKEELDKHFAMVAEAEKRDHKKIGPALGLFSFSELVGSGLPMFLPKGGVLIRQLEEFVREEKVKRGYSFVRIPHIAKSELYKTSGHLGKYDAMMPIMKDEEGAEFVLKAMNCPHHFELFNSQPHSYRDLPLRFAETTAVYRNEKSGELAGLLRVKALTQDDTHHFVRHDQIGSEIEMILGLMNSIYKVFGFADFLVQISVRDPQNKQKYFGSDELWENSEKILIDSVKKWGKPYVVEQGEAAFYGPKIDIMVKDAIGRMWQLTTVQLDFNQPENFNLSYIGQDGQKHRPAVLHVAILGSVERFLGVLIEHYGGAFPLWLSPVQVSILPISKKQNAYAKKVMKELLVASPELRVELDDRDESVGKKIREASMQKVPYQIILGEKEMKAKKIAIRTREGKDLGVTLLKKFVEKLKVEIEKKK